MDRSQRELRKNEHLKLIEWAKKHNISDNKLPKDYTELTNLKNLNLSDTGIKVIPSEICSLTNLEELFLGDNDIDEIPCNIGKLKYLTRLHLENTNIKSLPDELYLLKKLEYLTLGNCAILEISEKISQLNLKSLDLFGNKLIELPESIVVLGGLVRMNLQYNTELKLTEDQKGWINKLESRGAKIEIDPSILM